MTFKMPTLPQSLIDLIGSYGMSRTDGESEIERIHRWSMLIDGIKEYAADQVRAAYEHGRRDALDQAYAAMFEIPGSKVTRFDAQTAIRNLKDTK